MNPPNDPQWPAKRRAARTLTPEQQALADELHVRALAIRTASDGDLSITEAVHLAAVQLGLETPHPEGE